MNLIDEIVEKLSSSDGSLTDALLKTKVLLHKIGHEELVVWVNHELNGYPDGQELPTYRRLPTQVLANMTNGAWQATGHPVPLGHLTEEQRENLELAKMGQSLAVLEKMAGKGKKLQAQIPMEGYGLLNKGLGSGFKIQSAWCETTSASLEQIFIQVRSRLLDFILGLKDRLGEDVPNSEIKQRSDSVDASGLFRSAIFGNNTTIVVGSHNTQRVTNVSLEGNFDALAEHLKLHGISEPDVVALQTAISTDAGAPELEQRKHGPAVKSWLQKMLGKAVDTSWQIELGVAGNLLSDALKNYYGW
jgi:hypothetical protein